MKITFGGWFTLLFVATFFAAYFLSRWWRQKLIREALVYELKLDRSTATVGEPLHCVAIVENISKYRIPSLKLEVLLPDGVRITTEDPDHVGESTLHVLPPHSRIAVALTLVADVAGEYEVSSLEMLTVCQDLLGMGAYSRALTPAGADDAILQVIAADTPLYNHQPASGRMEVSAPRALRGSMRTGKLIAYSGIAALAMPYVDLLCRWAARDYAPYVALVLTPLMMAIGYLVQYLFLGRNARRELRDARPGFSYELGRTTLARWRTIAACTVTALIAIGVGSIVGDRLILHLQDRFLNVNEEVGIPLFLICAIAVGVVGCLLVPLQFHQILSIRTAVELLFPLMFLYAYQTVWAGGVNWLFVLAVPIYALCLMLCMNRETVLRAVCGCPSTAQTTFSALRRCGIRGVIIIWLIALFMAIPVSGLLSIMIMGSGLFLLVLIGATVLSIVMWRRWKKKKS